MLVEAGCAYVIIGHSETRGRFGTVDGTLAARLGYFGETDATINAKAKLALAKGLIPIICCGETIDERKAGRTDEVVRGQIRACLEGLAPEQMAGLVIAYEPVWAIGTGEVCEAGEADRVCGLIRQTVREMAGDAAADAVRVLYGGSVNDTNAAELLAKPEIDGALVGGASLKADSFSVICKAAAQG
jgi:triosephosphate isomerase